MFKKAEYKPMLYFRATPKMKLWIETWINNNPKGKMSEFIRDAVEEKIKQQDPNY